MKTSLPTYIIAGLCALVVAFLVFLGVQISNVNNVPPKIKPAAVKLFGTPVKVVQVMDGSTIQVKVGQKIESVDLYGIAAPPMNRPFGPEAKALLAALLSQGPVTMMKSRTTDHLQSNAASATFYVNGKDVAVVMLESGFAKATEVSSKTESTYEQMESTARAEKVGVWSAIIR